MKIRINQIIMNKNLKDYIFGKANLSELEDFNLMAGTLEDFYKLNFFQKIWASYTKRHIYFFDILTKNNIFKCGDVIDIEVIPFKINSPYCLIKNDI